MIVSYIAGNFNWQDEDQDEENIEIIYALVSGFPSQEDWQNLMDDAKGFFAGEIYIGVEQLPDMTDDIPYLTFRHFAVEYANA